MKEKILKQFHENEKWIVYGILLVGFIFFFILSWLSQGTYGGGDDYMHHQIAKFAFKHPEKFLYHWGKPFYTLLISPFAQLGYFGSKIFNLIIGTLTALFCYRIGKHFEFKNSWLIPIFVLFTPVYTSMLVSGMTEILFGFVLVLSVFLYLKNYSIASAIALSFLPFVRNEAIVIIPIFLATYIIFKNYKAIPFLLTGYVLYSVAGYFVFKDINWVVNRMPYGDASSIYGSGSLFHYIERTKSINGLPLGLLFVIGKISVIYILFKDKFSPKKTSFTLAAIILLPAITYYAAHSYVWWVGKGGSLGLIRVIAAISPLMAIVSLKGFEIFIDILRRFIKIRVVDFLAVLFFVVVTPFQVYRFPVPIDDREKVIAQASQWLRESEHFNRRILYYDSYLAHVAGFDPFDPARAKMPYGHSIEGDVRFDDNDVIVWDAQFGPNEGRMPREKLLQSPHLELVKVFKPDTPFTVLGGHEYEILIFISKPDTLSGASKALYENLIKEINEGWSKNPLTILTFENDSAGFYHISQEIEYALSQIYSHNQVFGNAKDEIRLQITTTIQIPTQSTQSTQSTNHPNLSLCASLESDGKIIQFWSVESKDLPWQSGDWFSLSMDVSVPYTRKKDALLKVFLWNISRSDFYVRDIGIVKLSKAD